MEPDAAVTTHEVPPCERRRRHPAASGKLTDVKLDLDVELPSDESSEEDGCTPVVSDFGVIVRAQQRMVSVEAKGQFNHTLLQVSGIGMLSV